MWHNLVLIYNRTRSGFLTNRSHFSLFIDGVEVRPIHSLAPKPPGPH